MTLIEAMKRTCEHVLANMTDFTVNRIHSQNKQDLRLDNGAGAYILLTGDQVLINGLSGGGGNSSDIIYFGKDKKCWICRNLVTGDLVFHTPSGNGFIFEDATTLVATAATFVSSATPDTPNYPAPFMLVSTTPRNDAVIQFNTYSLSWPVTSAKLRLYNEKTNESGITYLIVQRTYKWADKPATLDEKTVTWNNQLPYVTGHGALELTMNNPGKEGWIDFDVTELYNNPDNYVAGVFGICIVRGSGLNASFSGTQGPYPPELVIT